MNELETRMAVSYLTRDSYWFASDIDFENY